VTSTSQTLTDLLPEPIVLVSPGGVIRTANRAFLKTAHATRESIVGRTLTEGGWTRAGDWPEYLRRCARTRTFVLGAAIHRTADGSEVSYRLKAR
jgi:PAS domain-containing protein